jgi:hypothetical protein
VPDRIAFSFDPLCPWCFMTSKWVHQLERLGEVEVVDWRFLSLELVNGADESLAASLDLRAPRALRTAALVRREVGAPATGRFYLALDERFWGPEYRGAMLSEPEAIRAALRAADLDEKLHDRAMEDPTTWDDVVESHHRAVEDVGAFGVPTIHLDGGEGPAIFGPVISTLASDDDARELWHHVRWLVRHDDFWELKRERSVPPDLEGYRVRVAKAAAKQQ